MTAPAFPLAHRPGGGEKHALTRRDIEQHMRRVFPTLTAAAAKRTALAAIDVRRVRPEMDVLRWAEVDVQRRARGIVLLHGFDPTPESARRNIERGVPRV